MSSRISAGIAGITGMISVLICVAKIDQSREQKSTVLLQATQAKCSRTFRHSRRSQTDCLLSARRVRDSHPGRPVVPPLHSLAHSHRCRPTVVPHNTITPPQAAAITSKVTPRCRPLVCSTRARLCGWPKRFTNTPPNDLTGCRPHYRTSRRAVGRRPNRTLHHRFGS